MTSPLLLDLGTIIRHKVENEVGKVIGIYTTGGIINDQWKEWPVYTVQFAGWSSSRSAREWAKNFKVEEAS